jgi:hypothetical protein
MVLLAIIVFVKVLKIQNSLSKINFYGCKVIIRITNKAGGELALLQAWVCAVACVACKCANSVSGIEFHFLCGG